MLLSFYNLLCFFGFALLLEHCVTLLRTREEQRNFEKNTINYYSSEQESINAAKDLARATQSQTGNNSNNRELPPPPSKRRKKARHHLFREDGTARKRQQKPNQRRICKRMWQDDGITRGCGQNSHPRGVCHCWKIRGFSKEHEKNGTILRWLETTYGRRFDP